MSGPHYIDQCPDAQACREPHIYRGTDRVIPPAEDARSHAQFVVVTRYVHDNGTVIVHAYGAASKAHGQRLRQRFLIDQDTGDRDPRADVHVCKVL